MSKVRFPAIKYYKLLYSVKAWNKHIDEFWFYFNHHRVSKDRAAKIVLSRYYSTTAIRSMADFCRDQGHYDIYKL